MARNKTDIQNIDDAVEWFKEEIKRTSFGTVKLEVNMHESKPVSVIPTSQPCIRLGNKGSK